MGHAFSRIGDDTFSRKFTNGVTAAMMKQPLPVEIGQVWMTSDGTQVTIESVGQKGFMTNAKGEEVKTVRAGYINGLGKKVRMNTSTETLTKGWTNLTLVLPEPGRRRRLLSAAQQRRFFYDTVHKRRRRR